MFSLQRFSSSFRASLRWIIAIIFIYHGWQKAMNPEMARQFFSSIGMAPFMGPLMGWVEIALGVVMCTGKFSLWTGLVGAAIMVVAIATVQAPVAYQSDVLLTAGLERDLLIFAGCLVLTSSRS